MYLTKKHLSRRTVLRAAGVSLGLPLLDAMIPAATALAQTAAAPKLRAGFFYLPHGAIMWNTVYGADMDHWTPSGAGADFKLSPILSPLESHKRYVTSFGNLENRAPQGSVHTLVPATWLSGVRPNEKATGAMMAPTIDQMIAEHIGQDTVLPSLEVASETTAQSAACGTGACYYSSTLSFRNTSTPLPMEFNPRKLFQRLFGQGDTPEERQRLAAQYASILDVVADKAAALQKLVGPADRVMLSDYLESVREIERRVQKMEANDLSHITLPDAPVGIPNSFDEQMNLMFDTVALAWQANLTRITSFMMAAEVSNMTYNHVDVADAFHALSHHQNNAGKLERLQRVQTYHTRAFAKFVQKLAAMPDGDGSMLDHSVLLYGSNMSNSNAHDHFPLPMAIVGGGCGKLKGGQHLRYPDRTPVSNLLLTALNRAGVPLEALGDSTGEFTEV